MYNMQTSPIMANLKAVSKGIRQSQLKLFSNTLRGFAMFSLLETY